VTTRNLSTNGQLLSETNSVGVLNGLMLSNVYDGIRRRTGVSVWRNGSLLWGYTNGYDINSRLLTVSDGTNSAAYYYVANSSTVNGSVRIFHGSAPGGHGAISSRIPANSHFCKWGCERVPPSFLRLPGVSSGLRPLPPLMPTGPARHERRLGAHDSLIRGLTEVRNYD